VGSLVCVRDAKRPDLSAAKRSGAAGSSAAKRLQIGMSDVIDHYLSLALEAVVPRSYPRAYGLPLGLRFSTPGQPFFHSSGSIIKKRPHLRPYSRSYSLLPRFARLSLSRGSQTSFFWVSGRLCGSGAT